MFVVYVNTPNNKALVHDARCAFYRKNKGITLNGFWSDELTTLDGAMAYARLTGKALVRPAGCYL